MIQGLGQSAPILGRTPIANPPEQVSEVNRALFAMEDSIRLAGEEASDLVSKIQPILAVEPPDKAGNVGGAISGANCQLAQRIYELNSRLQALIENVRYHKGRVQV